MTVTVTVTVTDTDADQNVVQSRLCHKTVTVTVSLIIIMHVNMCTGESGNAS